MGITKASDKAALPQLAAELMQTSGRLAQDATLWLDTQPLLNRLISWQPFWRKVRT